MQYPSSIHSFTQITALLDHHALAVNRTFSHHTVSECFHKLQVETNSLNKARLLACSMPNANAWISALPSQQNKIFLFGMIYLYEQMARNAHLQPRPSLFSLAYAFQGFFWTPCFSIASWGPEKKLHTFSLHLLKDQQIYFSHITRWEKIWFLMLQLLAHFNTHTTTVQLNQRALLAIPMLTRGKSRITRKDLPDFLWRVFARSP